MLVFTQPPIPLRILKGEAGALVVPWGQYPRSVAGWQIQRPLARVARKIVGDLAAGHADRVSVGGSLCCSNSHFRTSSVGDWSLVSATAL